MTFANTKSHDRATTHTVHTGHTAHAAPPARSTAVLDPVCGMTISPDEAVGTVAHGGQTYHFCSQRCVDRFRKAPESFLGDRTPAAAAAADL